MAAIGISTAIILLASIDIGFLFYQKRELQKVADLAALAGAKQLVRVSASNEGMHESNCQSARQTAQANATANSFTDAISASCGYWDPDINNAPPHYAIVSNQAPNAVEVRINRSFDSFFGNWANQRVDAQAIAMGSASSEFAVFSVESRLLRIDGNGAVPQLLSDLGMNIDGTSLVSNDGLANARITPGGLLRDLGFSIPLSADIGTIKNLVATNASNAGCANNFCPLGALLGVIKVGEQGQTLNASSLGLSVEQLATNVKLLNDDSGRGILAFLETADGNAALNANISALDLVKNAIGAANSGNAVALDLGTNIPGVLRSETQLGIVEPPSIGIGGKDATAYTSQVRLYTRVESNLLSAGLLHVNLPIGIDIVNGKATIDRICESKDEHGYDEVTFSVDAPLLTACIGKMGAATAFSKQASCEDGLQDEQLVRILGNTLNLNTHVLLNGLKNQNTVTLSMHESKRTGSIGPNNLQLGDLVRNLGDIVNALLASILGQLLNTQAQGVTNTGLASELLKNNSLTNTFTLLDTSLQSLKGFANGLQPAVRDLLGGSLGAGLVNLLNTVGGLVEGLLNGLGNFLNLTLRCGLFPTDQCKLSLNLEGSQTSGGQTISNVLLSLLGLVTNLLQPILNNLGNALANQLHAILGAELGLVDVTLIDLQCGGESNVRLVY